MIDSLWIVGGIMFVLAVILFEGSYNHTKGWKAFRPDLILVVSGAVTVGLVCFAAILLGETKPADLYAHHPTVVLLDFALWYGLYRLGLWCDCRGWRKSLEQGWSAVLGLFLFTALGLCLIGVGEMFVSWSAPSPGLWSWIWGVVAVVCFAFLVLLALDVLEGDNDAKMAAAFFAAVLVLPVVFNQASLWLAWRSLYWSRILFQVRFWSLVLILLGVVVGLALAILIKQWSSRRYKPPAKAV